VPTAGTISGEGTIESLVTIRLGTAGTGEEISSAPLSVVEPLALNVKGGVGGDLDGLD
jgi:hypothetical protein